MLGSRMLSGMSRVAARRPLATSLTVTCAKASLADAMVQLFIEKKQKLDGSRSAVFASFGFLYQGGFQYWVNAPTADHSAPRVW